MNLFICCCFCMLNRNHQRGPNDWQKLYLFSRALCALYQVWRWRKSREKNPVVWKLLSTLDLHRPTSVLPRYTARYCSYLMRSGYRRFYSLFPSCKDDKIDRIVWRTLLTLSGQVTIANTSRPKLGPRFDADTKYSYASDLLLQLQHTHIFPVYNGDWIGSCVSEHYTLSLTQENSADL